ncbi:MAG: M4 family metallopeptidase [Bacteroidota bacterium]
MKKYFYLFILSVLGSSSLLAQQAMDSKRKNPRAYVAPSVQVVEINGAERSAQPFSPRHQSLNVQDIDTHAGHNHVWQIEYAAETGVPIFLKRERAESATLIERTNPAQALSQYLIDAAAIMPFDQPAQELSIKRSEIDDLGHTHIRLQQTHMGVPIYGAEGILHFSPSHEMLNGRFVPTPHIYEVEPNLTGAAAAQVAIQDVATHTTYRSLTADEQDLLNYSGPITELWLYPSPEHGMRLCYTVELRPNFLQHWKYFVDAKDGTILNHYDHTCSLGPTTATGNDLNGQSQTINVFEAPNGVYYLLDASKDMYTGSNTNLPSNDQGFILTADFNNTSPSNPNYNEITSNNNNWDAKQVSAHNNASICYDYFRTTFNRSSINGSGGDIISFINVAEDNGSGMDNAFWNGAAMFYGNGGGAFTPLAGALDVAGHEMAHGVIQNSANLEYQGQSGALNESFADIFGVMIDRNDWALGEDIIPNTSVFPTGLLRDVSNPHNGYPAGSNPLSNPGYQPRVMSEIFTGSQDNGGVHINSGIANYAFYKYCEELNFDRVKAEQVFYRALTQYLSRSSQFIDCRIAVIQAAEDLYGAGSAEVTAAQNAYAAVGLGNAGGGGGGGTVDPDPQLPGHTGQDFILSTDTDNFSFGTMYLSSTTGTNFQELSQTEHLRKVSITDDGELGYFVDNLHNVKGLFLDPSNPQEQNITNDQFWDNVAISKDGSKLAAISINVDTSIYVYSYDLQQWAKFRLYNPTFTQGVSSGGVLYADALEWDYSGEYLLYDSFNRIPNNNGLDREYWDIGEIKVWDNNFNTWGDGTIHKIFQNLADGISVGNAVYSKNSPNIIAFDYIDNNLNEYYLLAGNVETGDIGTVFQNGILSVPSYSKDDDKIIFNANNTNGDQIIAVIPLAADKINAAGSAAGLIGAAKWGVWYVDGQRPLSLSPDLVDLYDLQVGPNPMEELLSVQYNLPQTQEVRLELQNLMGQSVWRSQPQLKAAGPQESQIDLPQLAAGSYLLRVWIGEEQQTVKVVKY